MSCHGTDPIQQNYLFFPYIVKQEGRRIFFNGCYGFQQVSSLSCRRMRQGKPGFRKPILSVKKQKAPGGPPSIHSLFLNGTRGSQCVPSCVGAIPRKSVPLLYVRHPT